MLSFSAIMLMLLIIVCGLAYYTWQLLTERHRTRTLHALLENADQLESDIKECRHRLGQAHAMMSTMPGTPSTDENKARQAVDAGLHSLLQHRLWIRDHVEVATQKQLDQAVNALHQARQQMASQLTALDHAQRDLDLAIRERIERDKTA